jgi:hypothetical protein
LAWAVLKISLCFADRIEVELESQKEKEATEMDVEFLVMCDFAEDMGRGKLVIVGIFDNVIVKQVPAVHPLLSIAARIRFFRSESGKHDLKIILRDPDGAEIARAFSATMIVDIPSDRESVIVNVTVGVGQLKLNKLGEHSANLDIDGTLARSLSFSVRQENVSS